MKTSSRQSEASFQRQVIQLATAYGYRCYHTHDSRRSQPGFPDLVLVRRKARGRSGRVIFAELKTDKGRMRPAQQEWLYELLEADAEAYIWRPGEMERIQRILE